MIEIFEMCVRRAYELMGEQLEQLRANKKVKVKVSLAPDQCLFLADPKVYDMRHAVSMYSPCSSCFTRSSSSIYVPMLTTYKYVYMVGGFSESPYMYEKIKNFAASCNGLETFRPTYA